MSGALLVLEGVDGSGTTTQGHRLVHHLNEAGTPAVFTCQPSSGELGQLLRKLMRLGGQGNITDPCAMALLFAADRLDHIARVIHPALDGGKTVVCDRYVLSSLAYQGSFVDVEWVAQLNARARPADLTILVDVDVETAAKRRASRGGQPDQYEVDQTQRQVAENYRRFAQRPMLGPVVTVDGGATMEGVTQSIIEAVRGALPTLR